MANAVSSPVRTFQDIHGAPLESGFLYFGKPGLDPQTSPVQVYWDPLGTIPAAQPIRTLGGYPVRAGAPANVYAIGDYSISIKDKNNTLVMFKASAASYDFPSGGTSVVAAGADPTGATDSLASIQAVLNAAPNGSTIYFGGGTFKLSGPLVVPPNKIGLVLRGDGATLNCTHNGDGLVMVSTNQNFSRHSIYDMLIKGPNVAYPNNAAELPGTSTGYGLRLGYDDTSNTVPAYLCNFYGLRIEGFKAGQYLQAAILCNFYGGYCAFNQFGVLIDGGQTNACQWFGTGIRENRRIGVYSTGRSGGSLSNATNCKFIGCEIETNIPYQADTGGYPAAYDAGGLVGVGVKLTNTYDFRFIDGYMENHNFSAFVNGGGDGNQFVGMRFAPGGAGNLRISGVKIADSATNNTKFLRCQMISSDIVTANVFTEAGQLYTLFKDCDGFNFISGVLGSWPDIVGCQSYGGAGTPYGILAAPSYGYFDAYVQAGSPLRGTIGASSGGTTLNCTGLDEISIGGGAGLTGNVTFSNFIGLRPGQLFTLRHSGTPYTITVQSSPLGPGAGIRTKSGGSIFLSLNGHQITFRVDKSGRINELSNNT